MFFMQAVLEKEAGTSEKNQRRNGGRRDREDAGGHEEEAERESQIFSAHSELGQETKSGEIL